LQVALHWSPVAPFSTPSSHCSPFAVWTVESPQYGARARQPGMHVP
jgi:hypothetical protein